MVKLSNLSSSHLITESTNFNHFSVDTAMCMTLKNHVIQSHQFFQFIALFLTVNVLYLLHLEIYSR